MSREEPGMCQGLSRVREASAQALFAQTVGMFNSFRKLYKFLKSIRLHVFTRILAVGTVGAVYTSVQARKWRLRASEIVCLDRPLNSNDLRWSRPGWTILWPLLALPMRQFVFSPNARIMFKDRVMKPRMMSVLLFVSALTTSQAVWINEVHYDNSGTDIGEFIEVAGVAGADLNGYSLVLYNGTGGAVYDTINLSGTIPDQQAGIGTIAFFYAGIQNGAPDGIALVGLSGVIQFLSYEGTFTAVGGPANGMVSTDIGVDEDPAPQTGNSLQLIGIGNEYSDFVWSGPAAASAGSRNANQTFMPLAIPEAGSSLVLLGVATLSLLATWKRASSCAG
jgi:hypothetical protein